MRQQFLCYHRRQVLGIHCPTGTGKTQLAAFGYECCQLGKTYYFKINELLNKFTAASQSGKDASIINILTHPSHLTINEVVNYEFAKENIRLSYDLSGLRYARRQL